MVLSQRDLRGVHGEDDRIGEAGNGATYKPNGFLCDVGECKVWPRIHGVILSRCSDIGCISG